MIKIKSLANLLFTPGSLVKATREIEMENPPKSEAEKELSAYAWGGIIGLEACRIGAYLSMIALPILHYLPQK